MRDDTYTKEDYLTDFALDYLGFPKEADDCGNTVNKRTAIRIMTGKDYEGVYKLWSSCMGMGLNNLDDSKEGIEKFLCRNPKTCFVAEEDGEIAGAILAGNDGRRGYIYHTAVHPDYRHRGIATDLLTAAINALKEQGINKAALVVFSKNQDGNRFWERMGFTVREDLVYRNKAIVEMERIDT